MSDGGKKTPKSKSSHKTDKCQQAKMRRKSQKAAQGIVYSRAKGIADHCWPWAVFFPLPFFARQTNVEKQKEDALKSETDKR